MIFNKHGAVPSTAHGEKSCRLKAALESATDGEWTSASHRRRRKIKKAASVVLLVLPNEQKRFGEVGVRRMVIRI